MAIKYLDSKRIRGSSTSPIIQGYAGGVGGGVDTGNNAAAGGGGGATSVGGSYAENSVGGAGIVNPITGSIIGESSGGNYYLAGGGGGGLSNSGNTGAGGLGGGGDGVQTTGAGSGTANTGAGGGGNTSDSASSGAGGSGVVILKYLTSAINATGGTETTVETSYTISTFTSSGTFEITSGSGSVQYVVVAGGASGGAGGNSAGTDYGCGGGGAGGFLTGTKSMAVGTYTVTIGEGGVAVSPSSAGNDGNNSVFDDVTSTAGGGGCGTTNALKNGRNGGSGGGATRAGTAGTGVSTTQDDKATLITTIAASSADFTDIYDATSASGWTTNAGSGITINNHISGKLSANAIPDNSANRVTKALGLTLSDTSWVAQFEFMRTSGANAHYPFMVAAGTGQIWDATQDHIGIEMNSTGMQIKQRNGSSSTGGTTIAISADTQYYCTIIRNTADLITFEVRTVSHTGSHVSGSPQTLATSSSTSGLTTLHHSGRADGGAGSSSSWQVDNVNIYDGVVALISASSSTNLPENTLFEETDTRKVYFLQSNVWEYSGDAPNAISGLYAWYDANKESTITKDGSNRITNWASREGTTARDLTASSAQAPLYIATQRNGKNVVDLDALSKVMKTASAQTAMEMPLTIVAVAKLPHTDRSTCTTDDSHFLWGEFGGAPTFEKNTDANKFRFTFGNYTQVVESGWVGEWASVVCVADGASSKMYFNNVQKGSTFTGTGNFEPFCLGAHGGMSGVSDSHHWREEVGEVIIFSKALSASELATLHTYLAAKWDL